MKKVINGRVYNTETAKRLASWDNGLSYTDFAYCSETLYLTKSAAYFIHGEGGGNSRYGEWHGNSGGPGSQIVPLTRQEAIEWAEKLTGDEYENLFGNPEESNGRTVVTMSISVDAKNKLQRASEETGKSMSKIIDDLANNL